MSWPWRETTCCPRSSTATVSSVTWSQASLMHLEQDQDEELEQDQELKQDEELEEHQDEELE